MPVLEILANADPFVAFMVAVGGVLVVLGWQWRNLTNAEHTSIIGFAALVLSLTAIVLGASQLTNPMHFLTLLATVGVIDFGLWEWRRIATPAR